MTQENNELPAAVETQPEALPQSEGTPETQLAAPQSAPPPEPFEETPILPIDDRRSVQTDLDSARDDLLDLMESKQAGRLLTGVLHGIEHPEATPFPIAVIYHGAYKVIIPLQEAILPPDDYHDFPQEQVNEYLLTKRLGAEVDFVVKGIDTQAKVAVASRLDAMRTKRKRYYFGKDREGNDLIHIGTRAEARVMSSIRSGIFVELFGLEVFVPIAELSYQRLMDARNEFQPGQRVLVKVTELDKADRNNIHAALSVKQAKENPARKALTRFVEGNMYVGTVTMIRPNGIYVSLDGGIDCLCKLTTRARPPRGARVTVRILGRNEQECRIWGVIVHIAGIT